jgi:hypothetical protein
MRAHAGTVQIYLPGVTVSQFSMSLCPHSLARSAAERPFSSFAPLLLPAESSTCIESATYILSRSVDFSPLGKERAACDLLPRISSGCCTSS